MGVFEGKALYFCWGSGGWLFSIQWVVVFCEIVISVGGCLSKKIAVLWVSFVQMGSHGLLRYNSLKGGSPEKNELWVVGLNSN